MIPFVEDYYTKMIENINKDSKIYIDSVSSKSFKIRSSKEVSADVTIKSFCKNYFVDMVDNVVKNCDSYTSALTGRTIKSIVNQINNEAPKTNNILSSNKIIEVKSNNSINTQHVVAQYYENLKTVIENQSIKEIGQYNKLSQKEITQAIKSQRNLINEKSIRNIKNEVIQEVLENKSLKINKDVAIEVIQTITESEIEKVTNSYMKKVNEKMAEQEDCQKFEKIQKNNQVLSLIVQSSKSIECYFDLSKKDLFDSLRNITLDADDKQNEQLVETNVSVDRKSKISDKTALNKKDIENYNVAIEKALEDTQGDTEKFVEKYYEDVIKNIKTNSSKVITDFNNKEKLSASQKTSNHEKNSFVKKSHESLITSIKHAEAKALEETNLNLSQKNSAKTNEKSKSDFIKSYYSNIIDKLKEESAKTASKLTENLMTNVLPNYRPGYYEEEIDALAKLYWDNLISEIKQESLKTLQNYIGASKNEDSQK